MTVKVSVFCDVTPYSLLKGTEISECLAVCMGRVDLENVGSSEASIQLYHTTRRHFQVESDLHIVDRSRLPSACEKFLRMNSLSVYLSIFLYLFYIFLFQFLSAPKIGNLCSHESGESRCRDPEDSVRNVSAAKIPRIVFAYQS